jgi:AcrR family transcriptional regulator
MPKDAVVAILPSVPAVARRPRPSPDGRTRRAERSRDAIVDAVFTLVGDGVPRPTAHQVAARAGVGIRSVFRHFADMETLYAALGARVQAEVRSLFDAGPEPGPLTSRLRALVGRRAVFFERIAPYKRAAMAQAGRSPFLQARHRALGGLLRADLRRWLPEVTVAPPAVAAALELLLSFEAWDRLRTEQRLGAERARQAVECTVLALARELDRDAALRRARRDREGSA